MDYHHVHYTDSTIVVGADFGERGLITLSKVNGMVMRFNDTYLNYDLRYDIPYIYGSNDLVAIADTYSTTPMFMSFTCGSLITPGFPSLPLLNSESCIQRLSRIKALTYTTSDCSEDKESETCIGLDINTVSNSFPELVINKGLETEAYDFNKMIIILINAIVELEDEIKEQTETITMLEKALGKH